MDTAKSKFENPCSELDKRTEAGPAISHLKPSQGASTGLVPPVSNCRLVSLTGAGLTG